MSTYAIGDVQGCYSILRTLLKKIKYTPDKDFLWFSGDLVNRGPESLLALKFIKELVDTGSAITVLGNHDLHLLAVAEGFQKLNSEDTITDILTSHEKFTLLEWLRQQHLCYYEAGLNFFMIHAGLIPQWNIANTLQYSQEVVTVLQNDQLYKNFLQQMYGNEPSLWSETLDGMTRLRFITNVCTRLRYCTVTGKLNLDDKGIIGSQAAETLPWFAIPQRKSINEKIIFGHWASLYPNWNQIKSDYLFPIDSGCVWGNGMTAMCLETGEYFSAGSQ